MKYLLATMLLVASSAAASAQTTPDPAKGADAKPVASSAPAATSATAPAANAASSASGIAPGVTLAPKALEVKPGHYVLDPAHGKITWMVSHLGYSVYIGQFSDVSADLTLDPKDIGKTALTATVKTDSVGTFNDELEKQLKGEGFLDTSKYPTATFKSNKVTVTGPQTAQIDGDLTLDGKTAPIVISATFNNAGVDPIDHAYTVGFDGATIIRRSTFGASKYVPLVGDNVQLKIEGEFKLKS